MGPEADTDCRSGSPRSSPSGEYDFSEGIGVLAIQGDREHAGVLRRLGAEPAEVRKADELDGLDGLVIPGGESTAIMRPREDLRSRGGVTALRPAGVRHLRRDDPLRPRPPRINGRVGATERLRPPGGELRGRSRRWPGRTIRCVGVHPGARWRPPGRVSRCWQSSTVSPSCSEGRFLVASFHPELTDDPRVHELFLDMVREQEAVSRRSDAPLDVRKADGQYSTTAGRLECVQRA